MASRNRPVPESSWAASATTAMKGSSKGGPAPPGWRGDSRRAGGIRGGARRCRRRRPTRGYSKPAASSLRWSERKFLRNAFDLLWNQPSIPRRRRAPRGPGRSVSGRGSAGAGTSPLDKPGNRRTAGQRVERHHVGHGLGSRQGRPDRGLATDSSRPGAQQRLDTEEQGHGQVVARQAEPGADHGERRHADHVVVIGHDHHPDQGAGGQRAAVPGQGQRRDGPWAATGDGERVPSGNGEIRSRDSTSSTTLVNTTSHAPSVVVVMVMMMMVAEPLRRGQPSQRAQIVDAPSRRCCPGAGPAQHGGDGSRTAGARIVDPPVRDALRAF